MTFASALKAYRATLDCTDKELAKACGVSASTLSRYLNAERAPEASSTTIANVASGLARLSRQQHPDNPLRADDVRATLEAELTGADMVGMDFNTRLDALMRLAGIRNADIAQVAGVDPSYISRIRRGQRMPANLPAFVIPCSNFAANLCIARSLVGELGDLIGIPDLADEYPDWDTRNELNIAEVIEVWLLGDHIAKADMAQMEKLFLWLDATDFSEWLAIGNDVEDAPTPEPPAATARFYYGLGGMRAAELAFLNMAAEYRARELSLSSDMPLMTIEPGASFLRQYGEALVGVLRTGCHVNVVYSLERPLEQTIRSLQLWMPLYLTGRVTPYYLKGVNNRLFCHVNYVCDVCALASEAVMDHQEDGRYFFTARSEDVSYYQRKMSFILEKSSSMLEVYRDRDPQRREEFEQLQASLDATGRGRSVAARTLERVRVTTYPKNCTIMTVPCGGESVHFVIRHPKVNYIVSHME